MKQVTISVYRITSKHAPRIGLWHTHFGPPGNRLYGSFTDMYGLNLFLFGISLRRDYTIPNSSTAGRST